jgi:hypothetical protein
MKCEWCKQELATPESVIVTAWESVIQERAKERGEKPPDGKLCGYVLTLCMDCANSLNELATDKKYLKAATAAEGEEATKEKKLKNGMRVVEFYKRGTLKVH